MVCKHDSMTTAYCPHCGERLHQDPTIAVLHLMHRNHVSNARGHRTAAKNYGAPDGDPYNHGQAYVDKCVASSNQAAETAQRKADALMDAITRLSAQGDQP